MPIRGIVRSVFTLEAANEKHERNTAEIRADIEALEKRLEAEDGRWHKEKTGLETALRRARE
jgi:flagellar motility protein MotE (MotC chaperone)